MRSVWGIKFISLLLLLAVAPLAAQDAAETDAGTPALTAAGVTLADGVGSFGQPIQTVSGQIVNAGADAFTAVQITARAYDAADALIAEGFGVPGDACGASLPFEYALQPGAAVDFTLPLEVFEQGVPIERVEVSAAGTPTAPAPEPEPLPDGIRQLSTAEVVQVEWNGTRSLRFGVGCLNDLFSDWAWFSYNQLTDTTRPIEHPRAADVTALLRERLRLEDDAIFQRSRLSFDPDGTRLVYQDRVNYFYTAAADGTFQRLVHLGLNSYTLQEVYWLADDRYIAYYYGAFGDEVIYFTADAESRAISPSPLRNRPSVIRPGASADGRRVVLALRYDDPATGQPSAGYFISVVTNNFFELLFEAEPPGNNYPSPIPLVDTAQDRVTRVYVAREVDGQPIMQCFNRAEGVLYDLAPLPFRLTEGHRAQWWIAPDERSIVLAADGVGNGLWWIDLAALPPCAAQ